MYHKQQILTFLVLLFLSAGWGLTIHSGAAQGTPIKIIVDSDGGVDDSAAIAWLLSQDGYPVDVMAITTVAGNTSVEHAANNALIILHKVGQDDIPVIIGATAPLFQEASSTGALIHGPDGLWFAGFANPHDLSGLDDDVPAYYCAIAQPDVTLLALGPLTNLALALDLCPETIAQFGEIIILGGAKGGGNRMVTAEFNIWYDPEAAAQVLNSGLNLTVVPLATFRQFTITQKDIDKLVKKGTVAGQFLAGPIQMYANMQAGFGGSTTISLADVPATIYALDQALGSGQSGLIKMVPGIIEEDSLRLFRGQTVIGLNLSERITMIAGDAELSDLAERAFTDPNFNFEVELGMILFREPDNAYILTEINSRRMRQLFMRALTD